MDLKGKSERLDGILRDLGSVMIAFSGGTDSAFLAFRAYRALGEGMLAVIADSASLPRAELSAALGFAERHGIPVRTLHTGELDSPDYQRNDSQRCFHCKDELFRRMAEAQAELGFRHLAYGMNLDDRGEFRPGQAAAGEHGVVAPLVDAELSKAEIRALAQEAGLELWSKPASACLSSRIAYGLPVTRERLLQVEQAETALHKLGFPRVRVRHHDDLARIEIAREDLPRALSVDTLDRISALVKSAGFTFVTLDTEGYRTGSMNAVLPLSAVLPAAR